MQIPLRRKTGRLQTPLDEATQAALVTAVCELLEVQLALMSPEIRRLEGERGRIYKKSLGYIYGYTEAFVKTCGYDIGVKASGTITMCILRQLFPECDVERYVEFLLNHLSDERVMFGIIHGGQHWLDYRKRTAQGGPMGLIRYLIEDRAVRDIVINDDAMAAEPVNPSTPAT